jgi:hypothetical protein
MYGYEELFATTRRYSMKKTVILLSVALCLILLTTTAFAAQPVRKSIGQLVFVGASYIDLSYMRGSEFIDQFTTTKLLIRNLDPERPITLLSVKFFGPDGALVHEYVDDPIVINPFIVAEFVTSFPVLGIPPFEEGAGQPYFLVEWEASRRVNEPLISADMSKVRRDGDFIEFLASFNIEGILLREKRRR